MTSGKKGQKGFSKNFPDETYLNALSTTSQTTKQIREKVGCAHDTASKALKRLSDEGLVQKMEIEAGSGTGKMYLWSITKAGIKARNTSKEDQHEI